MENQGFGDNFPPQSIAVVGASRKGFTLVPGYSGSQIFSGLINSGYTGRVYPVNPKADEIGGVKAYPSVADIPEQPDLVIVTVPAPVVPQVIDDCVAAKACYVHIISSGFGETGEEQGKLLQQQVLEKAVKGGLKIIGPNCMGLNVPSAKINMYADIGDLAEGKVGFISQSGGHARQFLLNAPSLGIGFSKVISYGNGLMLDAVDFLEYLANDPETDIICAYLEGLKHGRRFVELVRNITQFKPVVLWKGGLTGPGSRAASSHTGSLAGDKVIWNGFYRQTGAIKVDSLEEMADIALAFQMLQPISNARTAVISMGGGSTVQSGDTCGVEGLEVPPFSPQTLKELTEFISLVNQGISNPMDVPGLMGNPEAFSRSLNVIAHDPLIDIILLAIPTFQANGGLLIPIEDVLRFIRERPYGKQIVVSIADDWCLYEIESHIHELIDKGIPVFSSLARACRALKRFAAYHHYLDFRKI